MNHYPNEFFFGEKNSVISISKLKSELEKIVKDTFTIEVAAPSTNGRDIRIDFKVTKEGLKKYSSIAYENLNFYMILMSLHAGTAGVPIRDSLQDYEIQYSFNRLCDSSLPNRLGYLPIIRLTKQLRENKSDLEGHIAQMIIEKCEARIQTY